MPLVLKQDHKTKHGKSSASLLKKKTKNPEITKSIAYFMYLVLSCQSRAKKSNKQKSTLL